MEHGSSATSLRSVRKPPKPLWASASRSPCSAWRRLPRALLVGVAPQHADEALARFAQVRRQRQVAQQRPRLAVGDRDLPPVQPQGDAAEQAHGETRPRGLQCPGARAFAGRGRQQPAHASLVTSVECPHRRPATAPFRRSSPPLPWVEFEENARNLAHGAWCRQRSNAGDGEMAAAMRAGGGDGMPVRTNFRQYLLVSAAASPIVGREPQRARQSSDWRVAGTKFFMARRRQDRGMPSPARQSEPYPQNPML